MSCLHLVSVGPQQETTLKQLDFLLGKDDAILLLANGLALVEHFKGSTLPVYLWSKDVPGGLSDDDVVTLILTFDKTMSWHD